ncbi:HNH endonuclease [Roseicyclus salinarum]|uniref:HNH endonuclease n=1 Tax=Roseicyclus salinarum TaxID=3036773 RepID=UPI003D33DDF8
MPRSGGLCEHCAEPAPFTTKGGNPYLEAHHIRQMTAGGPDDPRFVVAVCPTCHRRAHYGHDASDTNKAMLDYVASVEAD